MQELLALCKHMGSSPVFGDEKYVTKQNCSTFISEKNQILPSVDVVTGTSVISDGGVVPSIPSKIVSMSACKSVV
jgi:hypothetical protein